MSASSVGEQTGGTARRATASAADSAGAQLAILVPIYAEGAIVVELVGRLGDVLAGARWGAVFVDDSPDDIAEQIQ